MNFLENFHAKLIWNFLLQFFSRNSFCNFADFSNTNHPPTQTKKTTDLLTKKEYNNHQHDPKFWCKAYLVSNKGN